MGIIRRCCSATKTRYNCLFKRNTKKQQLRGLFFFFFFFLHACVYLYGGAESGYGLKKKNKETQKKSYFRTEKTGLGWTEMNRQTLDFLVT